MEENDPHIENKTKNETQNCNFYTHSIKTFDWNNYNLNNQRSEEKEK